MSGNDNPYLPIIHRNLPRLLGLYNDDPSDPYHGCGDRNFWAWKTSDFANGTYQGAVYGLAMLYKNNLLPDYLPPKACLERIVAMIRALPRMMDRSGGLSEALPHEHSFCVTALVLSDVLGALEIVGHAIDKKDYDHAINICGLMASFLMKQDEHHGIISNHLATAALAMVRWSRFGKDAAAYKRAHVWLDRIRKNAHGDGWLSEYGTADPGYQSWCCSALAQLHIIAPELELAQMLKHTYMFLTYFAMPDGAFAAGIGGRLTRFLFAGGAELMSESNDHAAQLALFARAHMPGNHFVTLDSIDAPNFIPFFNDTVLAAVHYKQASATPSLPYQSLLPGQIIHFEEAGLLIHRNDSHATWISVRRGGWMRRVSLDGKTVTVITEPVGRDPKGQLLSVRNGRLKEAKGATLSIYAELAPVPRMMPSAFKFIILRLLSLSAFRSLVLGNLVKKMLAASIMKPHRASAGRVLRRIDLADGSVSDDVKDIDFRPLQNSQGFSPSHMASQGYWQRSDEATK